MKLAEALNERAHLQTRARELRERLSTSVYIQEGDEVVEQPLEILSELSSTLDALQELIYRINRTNSATYVDGKSITELLAERDVLSMKTNALNQTLSSLMNNGGGRHSRSEIKYVRTIDPAVIRSEYEAQAKALRLLDLKIQEIGWSTDLK